LITAQAIFGWEDPLTGAAHVDPEEEDDHIVTDTFDWSPTQRVAGFRNFDRMFDTRKVRRGQQVLSLPTADRQLSDVRYRVWNFTRHPVVVPLFRRYSIADYMLHNNVTGLLVIKSGEIVLERYAAGNTQQTRWASHSVAKSVTSMLTGAAIADGAIKSTDDKVTDYLPALKGTPYEQTTIEHLLQMSSGVDWDESPNDENSDAHRILGMSFPDVLDFIGGKSRLSASGETFNYNTAETHVLGAVLAEAIEEDLATYLERKIWQPFGMESDANWLTYANGLELGGCCLSATLRDFGRLGLFAMRNGQLANGTSVLPETWMQRSTTPSQGFDGYGYLWWLNNNGSYQAQGVFGQLILVNPEEELVIATHSAWDTAIGDSYWVHQAAFVEAVTAALK